MKFDKRKERSLTNAINLLRQKDIELYKELRAVMGNCIDGPEWSEYRLKKLDQRFDALNIELKRIVDQYGVASILKPIMYPKGKDAHMNFVTVVTSRWEENKRVSVSTAAKLIRAINKHRGNVEIRL